MPSPDNSRQQVLYWNHLVQLKIGAEYVRAYRDVVAKRIWYFDLARAVTSSAAIGAWAVVQAHPLVWGSIIAGAQLADVVKGTLPLAKQLEGASQLSLGLDSLFIEAQFEWERIAAGRLTEDEISSARKRNMSLENDLQAKHFPNGLRRRNDLLEGAERVTTIYFQTMIDVET